MSSPHSINFNSCPPTYFSNGANSLSLLEEKFERACYLINCFNTTEWHDLPLIVDQLNQLKTSLNHLSTHSKLNTQEKIMGNAIGMAIEKLLEKHDETQKSMKKMADIAFSSGITAEILEDYANAMRMGLQTAKKQCFLTLELVQALFNCRITNVDDLNFIDQFFIDFHEKSDQNWYHNIFFTLAAINNLINKPLSYPPGITNCFRFVRPQIENNVKHLASLLDFFNILYESDTRSYLDSNLSDLEQSYAAFVKQLIAFTTAENESIYTEGLKLVSLGDHFTSKIQLPPTT